MARDNDRPVRRRTLTRDKVIDAALAVVDEYGWEQLTMSTLANRVGVTGASLYNHVRGLDDVRSEVQIRTMAALGDRLREEAMGRSGIDGLRRLIAAYRSWTVENHRRYRALTTAPIDRAALMAAALDANTALRAVLVSCGVPEEDSLDAAVALFAAVHGFAMIEGTGFLGDDMDLDHIFETVVDGALSAIAPSPSHD
ncbi:TetR/AcrR family transcriptional regulator [Rhodococcus zopfii]|uniref:TetR/AcrR family transcriptional regulator n=1 Tax=Rhodococcus zopfii TaxID=43772 RepID=UPI00111122CA|nr:TetR-like C-terminal domain-containing protein [Rhodococcus zopfii]